jgi:hypothetical protein
MIHAFRQIRLTNSLLTVTGAGVLQVGSEQVVYQSQTGVYATAANLNATGSFLYSLISSSTAGVSSVAGLTGQINVSGFGNIVITTGASNAIYISGTTGNFVGTNQTGQFYPNAGNPSGFLMNNQTGNITITTIDNAAYKGILTLVQNR